MEIGKSYCLLVVSYRPPCPAVRQRRVERAGKDTNWCKEQKQKVKNKNKRNLFNVVASFGAGFDKHDVKLPRLPFTFLSGDLAKRLG